jgi:hypothetical protein
VASLGTIFAALLAVAGTTQDVAQQLKTAIEDFEFGDHAAAAKKLAGLLEPIRLESAEDVIVARQYLGACYYLLDQRPQAEAEFAKILALDPEHELDRQVFSPALVQFFEEVRTRTGLALRKPQDPQKKDPPVATAPPALTAPTPESAQAKPPLALAFVPFGIGQFNNHHPVRGVIFSVSEAGLFGTALASFLMFQSVIGQYEENRNGQIVFPDTMKGNDDADRARSLQTVYLTTFYIGLGVLAAGVIEAVISYPGD